MIDRAAANTQVRIVIDAELSHDSAARHNLVLMGAPSENAWTKRLEDILPVRFGPREANVTAGK